MGTEYEFQRKGEDKWELCILLSNPKVSVEEVIRHMINCQTTGSIHRVKHEHPKCITCGQFLPQ